MFIAQETYPVLFDFLDFNKTTPMSNHDDDNKAVGGKGSGEDGDKSKFSSNTRSSSRKSRREGETLFPYLLNVFSVSTSAVTPMKRVMKRIFFKPPRKVVVRHQSHRWGRQQALSRSRHTQLSR
uniref:Uncharacterized protein n=1 Tax=Ditylenchus dipsaci TaxID=166011 RepID=A0A915E0F6_9BILA